jgi:CheY-like chemotaxis protein
MAWWNISPEAWTLMTNHGYFTTDLIEELPVGIVAINHSHQALAFNTFAGTLLNLEIGMVIDQRLHIESQSRFEEALETPEKNFQLQFTFAARTCYVELSSLPLVSDGYQVVFVRDVTEQVAVISQLKNNKQPERKFIHSISNALTTTMGYSELMRRMLDESSSPSRDDLASLKRYHAEVHRGLQHTDELIKGRKNEKQNVDQAVVPIHRKHVMVVDDEAPIAEFLGELMRARHYNVTTFTDSVAALNFYKSNQKLVDLVIMDQIMPELSGISLATELLSFNIDLPIVLCTGDQGLISEQNSGRVNIKHFIRKPIDISELTQMVSGIIG